MKKYRLKLPEVRAEKWVTGKRIEGVAIYGDPDYPIEKIKDCLREGDKLEDRAWVFVRPDKSMGMLIKSGTLIVKYGEYDYKFLDKKGFECTLPYIGD